MKPLHITIILLIILGSVLIFLSTQKSFYLISSNGNTLYCEIATTPDQRAMGLKHRASLYQNHGMLFVYGDSRPRTFIMTDCKFPIAIIFCDSAGKVVLTHEMKVNKPNEDKHYRCNVNAMYAIEANKNWFKNHGIKIGDQIEGLPFKSNQQ